MKMLLNKKSSPTGKTYTEAYAGLYGGRKSKASHVPSYNPELLPDPLEYYRGQLHRLRIRGAWADTTCPFHKDKHASFSVNLQNGGFICHVRSCDARGGNILDFHMKHHGVDFKTAAKYLGAWK